MKCPGTTQQLATWLNASRYRDWWQSKVPFYIAVTLVLRPTVSPLQLVETLGTIAGLASFGYSLNEIADRKSDSRAGRLNSASRLTSTEKCLFLLLTSGVAMALSLSLASDYVPTLFILACLILSIAYSAPPIRLKERGINGLVAPAVAQWSLPIMAIAAFEPGAWTKPPALCFALLGLALGVRWMGIHQVHDHWNDRVSGVRTYSSLGRPLLRIIVLALLAEIVLLLLLLWVTWPRLSGVAATLLVWIAIEVSLRNPVKNWQKRLQSYSDAPLGSFYFGAFPFAMLIGYLSPSFGIWPTAFVSAVGTHAVFWLRQRSVARAPQSDQTAASSTRVDPITAGLTFLLERQHFSGGFDVQLGPHRDLRNSQHLPCVFETAYLANILHGLNARSDAEQIVKNARKFLLAERESSGTWRYFLRGSLIPEEVDTIACALMVLEPDPQDDVVIKKILRNREVENGVLTWLLDPQQSPSVRNGVDISVNANVYTLLKLRSIEDEGIRNCLMEALSSRAYRQGSTYYPSPFFFLYAMAKIPGECNQWTMECLHQEVQDTLKHHPPQDLLEVAQACITLSLTKGKSPQVKPLLDRILVEQQTDGGWAAVSMCWGLNPQRFWLGSREMVTAFCIEAITIAK